MKLIWLTQCSRIWSFHLTFLALSCPLLFFFLFFFHLAIFLDNIAALLKIFNDHTHQHVKNHEASKKKESNEIQDIPFVVVSFWLEERKNPKQDGYFNVYTTEKQRHHLQQLCTVLCLLITLPWSKKAELRRAQLNAIGRMHMRGAYGCRETTMNDPGAQQPSQMFLTWVKARPQHRKLRALLFTNSVWLYSYLLSSTRWFPNRCKSGHIGFRLFVY